MKIFTSLLFTMLAISVPRFALSDDLDDLAAALSNNRGRTSGSTYDFNSGNMYNWHKNSDGSTQLNGNNLNTGSNWNTNIKRNGDMNGFDSNGNSWNYDEKSGNYYNFGTGKICVGKGYARSCF